MYWLLLAVAAVLIIVVLTSQDYSFFEWIIFVLFVVMLAAVGLLVATGFDVVKWFQSSSEVELKGKSEVYHVSGAYTYSEAKELCRAYGAKLANIEQVNQAYADGAEWCEYGWSDNNMVLYPTQTKTWEKFNAEDKQNCGRPGVNGGYNNNLEQKLGVNCYGVKATPPE